MPKCHSCRAPIIFVPTRNGKKMPLDPEPRPDGNVVLRTLAGAMGSGDRVAHVLADGEQPRDGETVYRAHFAACPQAGQHRRRK